MNLDYHGDQDAPTGPGQLDLAVNVRRQGPPDWLQARLTAALADLGRYPDQHGALQAVADRHNRPIAEVVLTNGAAEAFTLLARVLKPAKAICVHPSFTLPEASLRAAGHDVTRVILPEPFTFDVALIPDDADLVILGNPTNPTGVLHPAELIASLARPGRTLVVDEAFMDAVVAESQSLSQRSDIAGLVVVRSITKTWALAGLRAGYVLADPTLVEQLRNAQGPWPINSLALVALAAVSTPEALAWAQNTIIDREPLAQALGAVEGAAPFLLVEVPDALTVRERLKSRGIWTRRTDTFPGLDGDRWLRVAVPAPSEQARVINAFSGHGEPMPIVQSPQPVGQVTLIGAGPGDTELFTRKAWQALHNADVVITDRLIDLTLLNGLAPEVTIVDAGKAPGAHRMTQEEINTALIHWASQGHQVARLKGGDPFVFGRGAEEALACAQAGIPVTVIPGLSSAVAGPTIAGIPVTHRGVARNFAVLSGHLPPGHPANPVDWAKVAAAVDTLILLMAVANLPAITEVLLTVLPAETPAACIGEAGTNAQEVTTCTLAELQTLAATNPSVIVIGPTVAVLSS